MTDRIVEFGPYRLEGEPHRLVRGSEEVALRPKSLAVLAYLAHRPGRLVTKDELREQIWGTIHVSDTTLRVTVREIRAALGKDQAGDWRLETVAGSGYCFVTDPDASSGIDSAEGQWTDRPPVDLDEVIVGRQGEVEYLLNRFLEADKGRRQLVFLGGEPGAGKTTLVRLFTERLAERPGTTLANGQCVMSSGAGEAYGPVLEALGRLAAGPGGKALARLLDRCAPMWLMQLPAVVESGQLDRLQHRVEGATRERMVREINDVIEQMTGQATLVLVLEDLHWSDSSTVELLTSVAQRPEPARLLILATYRPADAVVSSPALRDAILELRGKGLCEHLNLELLTRPDVGAYVAARLGGSHSGDVADRVYERSGGNALFMVNVFDHLWQARAIGKLDGGWRVKAAGVASQVPVGLRPFIQRRLDTLSVEERRTLEMASVVGAEFDTGSMASGASPADRKRDLERIEPFLEALAAQSRLIEGHGVTEWPDGILCARYRFCHALYQEILYQEIPEARRARLHRMVGERIRAAFGTEAASPVAVLAVHFEKGRDAESAALYRRLAGERALARHAHKEAAQHFQAALDAIDQGGGRPADGDPGDAVRWELGVCMALAWTLSTTRGFADPKVTAIGSRARSLVECLDDPATQIPVLFTLWSSSLTAADFGECSDLVAQMCELAAGTGNSELAMLCSSAKSRTLFYLGDLAGCGEHLQRILTPHDPVRLADVHRRYVPVEHAVGCLGTSAQLLWLQGYPDKAMAQMRQTDELAERLNGPSTDALAGYLALISLQFRGETAQLDRRVSSMKRLCAEQGYALWGAWTNCFEGWVLGAQGNPGEGIARMERGVGEFRDTGTSAHLTYCLALLADLCLRAGRLDAAGEWLAEARAQAESSGERYWEAELHRLQGEVLMAAADHGGHDRDSGNQAEACLQDALEVARRQQARSLELRAALSLSRLWSRSRRQEALRLLGGVLETFTEGHGTADLQAAREQMARLSGAD